MMAAHFAATWINGEIIGREDILPCPFFSGANFFSKRKA
jgi:hypothetical protein